MYMLLLSVLFVSSAICKPLSRHEERERTILSLASADGRFAEGRLAFGTKLVVTEPNPVQGRIQLTKRRSKRATAKKATGKDKSGDAKKEEPTKKEDPKKATSKGPQKAKTDKPTTQKRAKTEGTTQKVKTESSNATTTAKSTEKAKKEESTQKPAEVSTSGQGSTSGQDEKSETTAVLSTTISSADNLQTDTKQAAAKQAGEHSKIGDQSDAPPNSTPEIAQERTESGSPADSSLNQMTLHPSTSIRSEPADSMAELASTERPLAEKSDSTTLLNNTVQVNATSEDEVTGIPIDEPKSKHKPCLRKLNDGDEDYVDDIQNALINDRRKFYNGRNLAKQQQQSKFLIDFLGWLCIAAFGFICGILIGLMVFTSS